MKSVPSTNGANGGRDGHGRFAPGNPGGTGNPHAKKVAQLRSAMLRSVTAEDMKAISDKLVDLAKDGNVTAAREVMDRCLGKSCEVDLIDRIEHLERIIAGARAS